MQTEALKAGTKIETKGWDFSGNEFWEPATICRWTKVNGPKMPGWHIIRFADGGKVCCHETRIRVEA